MFFAINSYFKFNFRLYANGKPYLISDSLFDTSRDSKPEASRYVASRRSVCRQALLLTIYSKIKHNLFIWLSIGVPMSFRYLFIFYCKFSELISNTMLYINKLVSMNELSKCLYLAKSDFNDNFVQIWFT